MARLRQKGPACHGVTPRRRSRLPNGFQTALIVQFMTGVPARTAAELMGANHHSATRFYQSCASRSRPGGRPRRPSQWVRSRLTRAISAVCERAPRPQCRRQRAGLWPAQTRWQSLHGHDPRTPGGKPWSALSVRAASPTALSTRIAVGLAISSMFPNSTTSASTTRMPLPTAPTISTASKTSGTKPSGTCADTVFRKPTSTGSSQSASGASITGQPAKCWLRWQAGPTRTVCGAYP